MLPPSQESTSGEEEASDEDTIPPYTVLRVEPTGDAPPAHDTHEGDAPPDHSNTCEDDLPSTEGDKVRSGNGEYSPVPTQEGDLPPAAGDEVRSSLGEHAPEPTQGGDVPPQPTRDHIRGPGPSGITTSGFNAILAAIRAGSSAGTLGTATPTETPPTATPRPPSPEVEDGTSPLKTRSGTIRGAPAGPKRRKPPPN